MGLERSEIFDELMGLFLSGVGTPAPDSGRWHVEAWSGVDRATTEEVTGLFRQALILEPRLMPESMQVLSEVTPAPMDFCATAFALGYILARREAVQALEDAFRK